MKRTVIDTVLRALKNALANWLLVIFRVIEFAVFAGITIFALVSTIVPVAVTAGLGKLSLRDVHATSEAIVRFLVAHATLLGWLLLAATVAFGVMLVIHSFIVAGSLRVYGEAERAAGAKNEIAAFNKFDLDTFWDAAWDGWWRVFAIYNLGGGAAGLLVLVPVLFLCLLMLAFPNFVLLFAIFMLLTVIVTSIVAVIFGSLWVLRALGEANARDCDAREALRHAWYAVRGDFARHFLTGLLLLIISFGGTAFLESMTYALFNSKFLENVVQIVTWGFSGGWWLATFVALAEETRSPSS